MNLAVLNFMNDLYSSSFPRHPVYFLFFPSFLSLLSPPLLAGLREGPQLDNFKTHSPTHVIVLFNRICHSHSVQSPTFSHYHLIVYPECYGLTMTS